MNSEPTLGRSTNTWRRPPSDWGFALLVVAGVAYAFLQTGATMDGYDRAILILAAPAFIALGWAWRPLRAFFAACAAIALLAINLYQGDGTRAESAFLLKYLIASQSAILWMSALYLLATASYWFGLLSRSGFATRAGSTLTWAATVMGSSGLLVRWHETYLKGAEVGHIPVSNLYEVFVLFALLTALIYLNYETRYRTRQLGAFVLLVITAAVAFLLWYTATRDAQIIQPLVPALQSWWMKLHVPANFVGYGAFAIAAMVGLARLLAQRGILATRLPVLPVLDDIMYRAIAVGFAFFTVATILGALWAAEAWGTYWQWDPKETWALIVWLNYAAWLHVRLNRQLRDSVLAWWAFVGLLITTFAFVGVNMFLSGLHSYGNL